MSKLPDLLLFDQQLTEEELAIQKTVRDYCDNSLMPRIQKANREELFDKEIYKEPVSYTHLTLPTNLCV